MKISFFWKTWTLICQMLIKEKHAVEYWGGTKTGKILEDGTWGED